MEAVGKFEFNRKELIGHGSFAVVFRGRHKEKHGLEVAIKCINKKNLAKSQSLLGKEIKILKELKHENIVGLLDFQEISGCVYLVMEYCNGGDLAEYLLTKGSLSEDTIRTFLQQIAAALSALRSKGIIHRDLKPQNILLSYGSGRRGNPNNVCIKLADFGFARYLQGNTMAATLCGSPMYMAPEVIMAQNYNAKADLWSVGTIVYQCLTGKAPFQANSPQELRSFYERNRNLHPNIPRETSSHLRHLLQGLLQRNHRDRMDFDEFFLHSFLEAAPAVRQSSPVPMPSYPSSGSGSSSSGSSNSHFTPPQLEVGQQRPHPLPKATPTLKDSSTSDTEDFVMVPSQFCSETGEQGGLANQDNGCSLLGAATCVGRTPPPSPSLRASPIPVRNYNQSVPVPVPTQIHNYQRMEHNLQGVSRTTSPMSPCGMGGVLGCGRGGGSPEAGPGLSHRRMSAGGCRPYQPSPHVATIPENPDQWETEGSRTEQQDLYPPQLCQVSPPSNPGAMETTPTSRRRSHCHSPDTLMHMWTPGRRASCPQKLLQPPLGPILGRRRTMPDLQQPCMTPALLHEMSKGSVKRSISADRLSDMLLKAVFGAQLERDAYDTLNAERPMDITALPAGERESPVIFTLGSPPHGLTPPPNATRRRCSVGSCSLASHSWNYNRFNKGFESADGPRCVCVEVLGGVAFEPPELPEETLMEQGHTDMLARLRFTLAFAHCAMEMAAAKDGGNERSEGPDVSFLEQSIVADQISQLSREWSYAEQLVLYMKCAELLSTALHTAIESIKQDKLYPSASIKQVIRKLNELYKECVTSSRSLTARLQLFFSTKQRLMDRINNITAEKIIYSHTVQMVQDAALDEMFHRGEASAQRYHKALLLMEGLSLLITERTDLSNINKCKQCIERRLSSLQPGACV